MTKPKSSKNALLHGAYSKLAVLPWEDEHSILDFYMKNSGREFLPDGVSEEATVFEIAVLQWRKMRLNRRVPPTCSYAKFQRQRNWRLPPQVEDGRVSPNTSLPSCSIKSSSVRNIANSRRRCCRQPLR